MKEALTARTCVLCGAAFSNYTGVCPDDGGPLIQLEDNPFIGTFLKERYEIVELAGYGAMSVVFRGVDSQTGNFVAVKSLHKQLTSDAQVFARFKLEIQATEQLKHPNIITVFDAGITGSGEAFFVMDFVEGLTLEAMLNEHGNLPAPLSMVIFDQVCDGLAHAHKQGILHRDLKPGNIIIPFREDEAVRIVDFGVAKLLPQADRHAPQLTAAGEVCGSPHIMSPEQCLGEPLDARSDLYSLGCLMYETLTGVPPLLGESIFETMSKHVNERALPFKEAAPTLEIPEFLEQIVFRCLEKDPKHRFQSATEVRLAFRGQTVNR